MTISEVIARARKRKGLETYAEFAKFLGVSTATVHAWEHGKFPSPRHLKTLAEKLEIDIRLLSRVQMAEKIEAAS